MPAFPFFVVNLAPALLGVPLRTYVLATFLGIIPGTTAFSVAGAGLGSVVEAQNKSYKACAARHPTLPMRSAPIPSTRPRWSRASSSPRSSCSASSP